MKQNFKVLVLLPIVALTACANLGKEVDEKAVADYKAELAKQEEPKCLSFTMNLSGTTGKDKQASKSNYKMKQNAEGDKYFYTYSKNGDSESKVEVYQVKNEQYEEVTWIDYSSEAGKLTIAYAKKDNTRYNELTSEYVTSAGMAPSLFYLMVASPDGAGEMLEADEENAETKFYSNGEANLSMKITLKKAQEDPEEEEWAVSGNLTITYNNYRFASLDMSAKTNLGNSQSGKASASYDAVSLSLPSGWEKVLAK